MPPNGSNTPITAWLLYADHKVAPICRSLTGRVLRSHGANTPDARPVGELMDRWYRIHAKGVITERIEHNCERSLALQR
jgi:hypothetical protein